MRAGPRRFGFLFFFLFILLAAHQVQAAPASWRGTGRDSEGHPIARALGELHATSGGRDYSSKPSATGGFAFGEIAPGTYSLAVTVGGKIWNAASSVAFKDDAADWGVREVSSTA